MIPRWNPELRKVFTTYRCGNCWLASLDELRAVVRSGEPEVRASFWDFLGRHGYTRDLDTLRAAPPERQLELLLATIDAVQAGTLEFDP